MSAKVLTGETSDCCQPKMTWLAWLAVILAVGPFIIKRIILLGYQENYAIWLTLDYVGRCVSLLGVMLGFKSGLIEPLKARTGWFVSCVVLAGLVSTEWAEQTFIYPILRGNLDYLRMFSIPQITDANVRWADLIFGCLLVAVSEELVFRRLMFSVLGSKKFVPVIFLSALIFALVHFTSGVANSINVFIHGVLLGGAFWITRRVSVCIVSHYVIDLKIFSGL
jgi:membrane protease YdiL (CAAX protease family)